MKVSVLGGGSEVGASCLHIEMAGTKLLIDAGMRMHGDDPLPALGMLEDLGHPEAVLVTHAHADHIGALPIIRSLYPNIPIYATPPTVDLMKIMMRDSFKILESRCLETKSLPPYTEQQVNALLESLLYIPASGELRIGHVKITSYRAGHILGAVMFLIEGEGEKLFVTGDLSFKAGRTIQGAQVPHNIRPDVVIMESTYGNRAHTDRHTEENRLANHVAEVVSSGGFALIPAFALGRAQEVLLILQDYMDKGLIPEFPIYVDGLVTPISRIYNQYPHYLKGPIAHRIRKNGDVFLQEGRCKAVLPKERESVLNGKPGCIVASSGMLIGGASSWYAEKLVSNEKNAIFITGYQDEESPGRKLLNIVDGIEDRIELNGISYEVKCRVGKYGLSAHADANEMNRFIQSLNPTYTLLVHGDDEARNELSKLIDPKFHPILVENGEMYPFERRSSGKGVVGKRYNSRTNTVLRDKIGSLLLYQNEEKEGYKLAICTDVHERTSILYCQTLKGKLLKLNLASVVETVDKWSRSVDELKTISDQVFNFSRPILEKIIWTQLPNQALTLNEIYEGLKVIEIDEKIAVALALQALPNSNIDALQEGHNSYKINESIKALLTELKLPIQGLRLNPANAMDEVRSLLADHPRFIRCGVDHLGTEKEQMTIYFDFPDAVNASERLNIMKEIHKKTGWNTGFSDSVRQDLLQAELSKLLGGSIGSVSIHLHERKVVLSLKKVKNVEDVTVKFKEVTGFSIQFKEEMSSISSNSDSLKLYQANTASHRLENNQAIDEAKKWAEKRGITIYKTSMKQLNGSPFMEIHFISPEIARQHEIDLEELSFLIGMPVTFTNQPKQNEIIRFTVESIPAGWELKKNPSIHIDKAAVSVKLQTPPDKEEERMAREKIKELTGYELEVIF